MTSLFGTDGVRGEANRLLTPELAMSLARAAARLVPSGGRVIIGRDSRTSGPMLEAALAAGFASAGVDVGLAGIIPTPAISFLIKDERADLGAVISASHNPPEDNGIKFFDRLGCKLVADQETAIEAALPGPFVLAPRAATIRRLEAAATRYAAFLTGAIESEDVDLSGLSIVIDCACGATGPIAPHVLRHLGARVVELNTATDGDRINVGCGSTHLETVRAAVAEHHADLGLAFDGDGDRVLLVSSGGRTIDGDQVIGIVAQHWLDRGLLTPRVVVTTVLSNFGLERALTQHGVEVVRTPVGDRNVAQAMIARGAKIGGEPSGHVIFADHAPTGDGILTAVKLLEIAHEAKTDLETLARRVPLYPQASRNVPCRCPVELAARKAVADLVSKAEKGLGGRGRVIVRPSGTQPLVRILVEADSQSLCDRTCAELAAGLELEIGRASSAAWRGLD
ncbi:MAG: phosphoglucosamine mutase [Candidatus Bipolaricaulis sp.]|nr:phosphoglucosamine mutase [Candidatus Bipolaricaulis sp.]